MLKTIKTITKKELRRLNFPPTDVLKDRKEKNKRKRMLKLAMRNRAKTPDRKPTLVLSAESGYKKIQAHIAGTSHSWIAISGSRTFIPIRRIVHIHY